MNKPVAWIDKDTLDATHIIKAVVRREQDEQHTIPLYTHPVKEQNDYCKAYWGNDNKFVDVFLPNSETEVIRFWNNTHPVKELNEEFEKGFKAGKEEGWKAHKFHHPAELTDEEIMECKAHVEVMYGCLPPLEFAWAILRKAQEK